MWSDRRGRLAIPVTVTHTACVMVRQARERSLSVHGANLFNLLPIQIRNEDCGDFPLFKNHLDIFLATQWAKVDINTFKIATLPQV